MPEAFRTPSAESDLLEIWLYISSASQSAANRLLEAIDLTCHTIAEYPNMGRSRLELSHALRSFPVGNYVIFYRPIENGIEVIRVLSQARDIDPTYF